VIKPHEGTDLGRVSIATKKSAIQEALSPPASLLELAEHQRPAGDGCDPRQRRAEDRFE